MKKILTTFVLASSLISTNNICAQEKNHKQTSDYYWRFTTGISFPSHLKEQSGSYLGPSTHSNPKIFALAFGYHFNEHLRADISIRKRETYRFSSNPDIAGSNIINENIKQSFTNVSYMLNTYYDFNKIKNLTPYLTFGIGCARNRSNDYVVTGISISNNNSPFLAINSGDKATRIAFDLGFGGYLKITDNINLDFNYKYAWLGKFVTSKILTGAPNKPISFSSAPVTAKFKAQELSFGLVFKL